jgi:signal peptidase II
MLRWGLLLAAITILLDQLTKWVMLGLLMRGDEPIVVTPFFNLVMVWNRGVSFGLFDRSGALAPWVLSGLALAVVVALIAWLRQTHEWLSGIGLGLVIGGALGNVIDRVRLAAVVDFLDFHLAGWHWPAFNLADSAICVGAALLVADGLLGARRQDT